MRKIVITGVVALAAVLGTWGAVSSPAHAVVNSAAGAPSSSAGVAAVQPSYVLSGTRPGAVPATHPLAYPAGVTPATTAPDDVLDDVSCFSQGDCLAVGANYAANGGHGSPRAYKWNGSVWTQTSVPLPSNTSGGALYSLSCTGSDCLAVGVYFRGNTEYLLGEVWNGTSWSYTLPPYISGSKYPYLSVVSCVSATFCVAGGGYAPTSNLNDSVAIAEIWNGQSWTLSKPPPVNSVNYAGFYTVSCTSTTFCLLGGEFASTDHGYFTTLVDQFNGTSWTRLTDAALTVQSGYATYINSISCTSSTACMAVGEYDKYSAATAWHGFAETLSGSAWTRSTAGLSGSTPTSLNAVSCASSTYCVAVGGAGTYTHATTGKAIFSVWTGSSWKLHFADPPSGQGNVLIGDQCLTSTYCVATGSEGTSNTNTGHGLTWFWNGASFTLVNTT